MHAFNALWLILILLYSQSSWSEIRYSEVKLRGIEDAGAIISKLVVEDTYTGRKYETEPYSGRVEMIDDPDGDGNPAALLSLACEGSGCPQVHRIVALENGALASVEIPGKVPNTKVKHHEMLCDFDTVIAFDGEKWVGRAGERRASDSQPKIL
jgi:hypothetical protein